MTSEETQLTSNAELNAELRALLVRAHESGIDVEGEFECRNGVEHPDWDIIVTEVEKNGQSERPTASESGSVGGNGVASDQCRNGDRIESVLSAQRERVLRALLKDRSRPADPILRESETLDHEEYLSVCYELHHVLLPELADEGLVEFDRFEDEIRRGTRFDEVCRFLERIDCEYDA